MFRLHFWYDTEKVDKKMVETVAIRCNYCVKETGLSMKNMNRNYNDIITKFVFNTILHNVGVSWIIESNQQLKYGIDKHSLDCITGGPWYKTYICKKLLETVFEIYIINARTDRYKLIFVITLATEVLEDVSYHFLPCRRLLCRDSRKWSMVRVGREVRSRTDYILVTDRRLFWNVYVWYPRHNSDRYLILGCLRSAHLREQSE